MSLPSTVRLIICGGIGSGKSVVGRALRRRGVHVIDADRIGHRVLQEVAAAVAIRWPETVVDGIVDRKLLGSVVFADPVQLRELEDMTHPAIVARIEEEAARHRGVLAVELPLQRDLLGHGWIRVVVDAPLPVRRRRLRERGMSEEHIAQRLAVQPGRQSWLKWADFVLDNSGGLDHLDDEVDRLWRWLAERDRRRTRGGSSESEPPPGA